MPVSLSLSFGPLWRLALRRPAAVLAVALLAIAFLGFEARRLRLEPTIDLLADDDPAVREDDRRRAIFGEDFRLLLALFAPEGEGGILRRSSLEALDDLHRSLAAEPGIGAVASLADAPALVASDGLPAGAPLVDDAVLREPRMLFQRLRASDAQKVMMLSLRESLTPVFVEPSDEMPEPLVARRVTALAGEVEARHRGAGEVLVVGPAIVETRLAEHVFDDLARLVPFTIGLVIAGLLLAFRRPVFLLVALTHALALEAVILGGMAACGWSVDLVSVLAPVILVPVGVADLLHLFVQLQSQRGDSASREGVVGCLVAAFERLERPMVMTTLTTVLGFLTFALAPVASIRQFGVTLAGGALAALLLTFTLDAALLALLWRPLAAPRASRRRCGPIKRWLLGLLRPGARRRRSRMALVAGLLLAAAGLAALPEVEIEDTWIRNFDPRSRVVRDARHFEGEHLGTNVLALTFEAASAAPRAKARTLEAVNRFTTSQTVVLGVRGILSATLLARSLDPDQDMVWKTWPTPSLDEMAAAMGKWERHGMTLPRMRTFMTPELDRFQVLVFVLDQPYRELVACLERVTSAAEAIVEEVGGGAVRVGASGNLAVNIRMVREVVHGHGRALGILLLTITILLAFLVHSPRTGGIIVLPMILAISTTFVALVLFNLPYGIAVSMFPALVVGLSVDFALHLRAALMRHRAASGTRWAREVAVVLRGILLNGLLWAAGFAVLGMSSLPPNRYLGLLCGLVVALSTAFTFLFLPTLAGSAGASSSGE